MAISNKTGKIVLTTGNKSEMAVGYATLYGDMAGGFAAIKDVPKTLVYRLAEWRNGVKPVIPRRIIERPPSAELAPDQKDTGQLAAVRHARSDPGALRRARPAAGEIVAAGFDAATVSRVVAMVDGTNTSAARRRPACASRRAPSGATAATPSLPVSAGGENRQ